MNVIYKVGIVGGGVMGSGLARLLARSHVAVVIKERTEELAQKAHQDLCDRLDELAGNRISFEEAELQKSLICTTAEFLDFSDANLAIEAVWEDLKTKKEVLEALDAVMPGRGIIASNTSGSFLISELAKFTLRPDRVIGTHFFNPPTRLPLVEIVRGEKTSDDTFNAALNFVEYLGQTAIRVKDRVGFLANPLLFMYLNEAALALAESDVDPRKIDTAAVEFGWPMGPFTLLDTVVGIDVARDIAKALSKEYGARMRPSELLMYLAGEKRFGKKNGAGVYTYNLATEGEYEPIESVLSRLFPNRTAGDPKEIFERMMLTTINEAARCLEEEVATPDDIEITCIAGLGFPFEKGGVLHYADELGLVAVVERLEALEARFGIRFSPAQILQDKARDHSTFFENW